MRNSSCQTTHQSNSGTALTLQSWEPSVPLAWLTRVSSLAAQLEPLLLDCSSSYFHQWKNIGLQEQHAQNLSLMKP